MLWNPFNPIRADLIFACYLPWISYLATWLWLRFDLKLLLPTYTRHGWGWEATPPHGSNSCPYHWPVPSAQWGWRVLQTRISQTATFLSALLLLHRCRTQTQSCGWSSGWACHLCQLACGHTTERQSESLDWSAISQSSLGEWPCFPQESHSASICWPATLSLEKAVERQRMKIYEKLWKSGFLSTNKQYSIFIHLFVTLSALALVHYATILTKRNDTSLGIFWLSVLPCFYTMTCISLPLSPVLLNTISKLSVPPVISNQPASAIRPILTSGPVFQVLMLSFCLWNPENWDWPAPSNLVASSLNLVGLYCCYFHIHNPIYLFKSFLCLLFSDWLEVADNVKDKINHH